MHPHASLTQFDLPPPPRTKLRLGLIGLGWVTKNCHIPALQILRGQGWPIEISAVCDRLDDRLQSVVTEWPDAIRESNPSALLSRAELDGVLILTRPDSSSVLLRQAIELGRTSFVEKPVAQTLSDIQSCSKLARALGVQVQVGYNRRHQPLARELARQIAGLNPPWHVKVQFWRAARDEPGFFDDTLVHSLDFVSGLVGKLDVKRVWTWPAAKPETLDRGWRIDLAATHDSRITVEIDIRPATGREMEVVEVIGHKRSIALHYPHPGFAGAHAALIIHEDGSEDVVKYVRIPSDDTEGKCYHSGFVHQMAEFALLCAGTIIQPGCSLDDSADALRLRDNIAEMQIRG